MVMFFRGSLTNLSVTFLGEQFSSVRSCFKWFGTAQRSSSNLAKEQGDRDGQEGELDARVLALLVLQR